MQRGDSPSRLTTTPVHEVSKRVVSPFLSCIPQHGVATLQMGREPFLEGSRVDILCTLLHYICFMSFRWRTANRWVTVGCYYGSRYKKFKPTTLEQGWAISGPRATCGPPHRFQWPARAFIQNLKSEISSSLVLRLTCQWLAFISISRTALRWKRPSKSGP